MSEVSGPTRKRMRIVLVTGLSGGGKASALRAFEDLGYEAVDNPPLRMLEEMASQTERRLAVGVDARTTGFDATLVLESIDRLRTEHGLQPEMVYLYADETTLLRRYTESRRRHPLAPQGRVADGIAQEQAVTAPLRARADVVIDTSELPIAALRRLIERQFGEGTDAENRQLVVSLVSFAYPQGLPREADLVFDSRFLRNPHYDPILRSRTGLDPEVGAFVAADPDFKTFFDKLTDLIDLLLPRFVQEGKKYATITIGCTGGRHRSVYLIERLADYLASRIAKAESSGAPGFGWHLHVMHRELAREGHSAAYLTDRPVRRRDAASDRYDGEAKPVSPVQAREA